MRTLALLLIFASPFAFAQFGPLDGGQASCTAQQCNDFISKRNQMQATIMDNLNCTGHGHTASGSPLCPLSENREVTGTLIVAGNSEAWRFKAKRLTNDDWQLDVVLGQATVELKVYWYPTCMFYKRSYFGFSTDSAMSLAIGDGGGSTFHIIIGGHQEPNPWCYWMPAISEDNESI